MNRPWWWDLAYALPIGVVMLVFACLIIWIFGG